MKRFLALMVLLCVALTLPMVSNAASTAPALDKDREGNAIQLPEKIQRIMSFGPSNTEIITALGDGDKLVAVDEYSDKVAGVPAGLPLFTMATPDAEKIISLKPDVIFVTGMSKVGGTDPYKAVTDAGVCLIYMPSSKSIEEIKQDVRFVSSVLGKGDAGEALVQSMESEIAAVQQIGQGIADKKRVYFEISAAPYMYSFGSGVYLNEMIQLIGAQNVLANQKEWVSVTDEVVLGTNPDVILTCVNYVENPTGEIKGRPGWDALDAVKNNAVFYIDADSSNRPNQNIIKALKEMAHAVYPEYYK